MSLRAKLSIAAGIAIAVLAAAVGGFWFFFLRSSSPPPVSLQAALTSVAPNATQLATAQGAATTNLAGTWTVVAGSSSFVGYRVNEKLASIGANTAVGRTQNVQGTLVYDGSVITSVQITADLTTLTSDKNQRDGALRNQAIETGRFPTATFALTTPISIGGSPQGGVTVTKTVQGNLTLHGVTRPVSIDIQGQLESGQVVVVGSTMIKFSDFGITPPSSFSVLSIDDHGVMEFQLVFGKAAA